MACWEASVAWADIGGLPYAVVVGVAMPEYGLKPWVVYGLAAGRLGGGGGGGARLEGGVSRALAVGLMDSSGSALSGRCFAMSRLRLMHHTVRPPTKAVAMTPATIAMISPGLMPLLTGVPMSSSSCTLVVLEYVVHAAPPHCGRHSHDAAVSVTEGATHVPRPLHTTPSPLSGHG